MADLSDIINTLIAEANAEGPEGMRRVGETILNRAAIRGIDPAAVVRQPHQYTGYFAPGPAAVEAQRNPQVRTAAEAAWELARQPGDPTGGADHYYNPSVVDPGWQNSMQHTGDLGGHTFYRSRSVPADALRALLTPGAPTPFAPPARGNVPSDLISRSLAGNASAQARSQIADMFGPAANRNTPRLTGAGAVANPSAISTDWARNIFPDTSRRAAPIIAAPDLTRAGAVDGVHTALAQDNSLQDALRQKINSQGTTVASFPSKPAARPLIQLAQTFAGQERAPAAQARLPVIAATSGVGKAPATRSVQSVPVSRSDPVGTAPKFADMAAMFAPTVPSARTASTGSKAQDRLPATPGPKANAAAPGPAMFGGLDPSLAGPAPSPKSPQLAQVARAPKPAISAPAISAPVIEPAPMRIAQTAPKVGPQVPARRPAAPRNARVAITSPQVPARRPNSVAPPAQVSRPAAAMAYAQPARRAVSPAAAAIAQSFNTGGGGNGGESGGGSFQGTATGNNYNAGQRYQTGDGRVLEANRDGSFTNVSTGQKSVGSSRR